MSVSYSLWLVPDDASEAAVSFRTCIKTAHVRVGSPLFSPHVTLLGDLVREEAEVVTLAESLASDQDALLLTRQPLQSSGTPFRILYAGIEPSPALLSFYEKASRAFKREDVFLPHLSLAYGTLTNEQLDELKRQEVFQENALPHTFTVTHLEVWRTEGAVSAWEKRAEFLLSLASRTVSV